MQCITTITKQSHDITRLTRDVGLLEHKMALHSAEIRVIQGSPKEGQNKAELTAVLVLFQVRTVAVYGEHPASKFKSLLELPNDLGLDNIANQSKT